MDLALNNHTKDDMKNPNNQPTTINELEVTCNTEKDLEAAENEELPCAPKPDPHHRVQFVGILLLLPFSCWWWSYPPADDAFCVFWALLPSGK